MERARRRALGVWLGAAAVAVLGAACARGDLATPAGPTDDRAAARAAVYAQVVRQLVVVERGGALTYDVVYVLDGAVRGAGDPMASARDQRPRGAFPAAVRAAIRDALPSARVVFTQGRAHRLVGATVRRVRHDGVVVSLGRVRWRGGAAIVPSTRFAGTFRPHDQTYAPRGKDAQWATYRVVRRGAGWRVVGTVGGVTIS
jgi:hypothetical protein